MTHRRKFFTAIIITALWGALAACGHTDAPKMSNDADVYDTAQERKLMDSVFSTESGPEEEVMLKIPESR